jgi:hypothetical protein
MMDLQAEVDLSLIIPEWFQYRNMGFQAKLKMEDEIDSTLKLTFNENIMLLKLDSRYQFSYTVNALHL